MNTLKSKTRDESRAAMTELVLPNDANIIGNLLGGRLLHWIDISGALAASRHAGGLVATVYMDAVEFKHPIKTGWIVTLNSYVTWTGETSLETAVEVYAENPLDGTKQFINRVYIMFVAVDKDGLKRPVAPLLCKNQSETDEFNAGFIRKQNRKKISGTSHP